MREAAGERSGEVADMMRSGFLPETADRSARGSPSLFASLVWMIPPHTHTPSYKRSDYENTQPVAPPGVSSLR